MQFIFQRQNGIILLHICDNIENVPFMSKLLISYMRLKVLRELFR